MLLIIGEQWRSQSVAGWRNGIETAFSKVTLPNGVVNNPLT